MQDGSVPGKYADAIKAMEDPTRSKRRYRDILNHLQQVFIAGQQQNTQSHHKHDIIEERLKEHMTSQSHTQKENMPTNASRWTRRTAENANTGTRRDWEIKTLSVQLQRCSDITTSLTS
jgi:hypothetical protein